MANTHLAALFTLLMAIVSVEGETKKERLLYLVHQYVDPGLERVLLYQVHRRAQFKIRDGPMSVVSPH